MFISAVILQIVDDNKLFFSHLKTTLHLLEKWQYQWSLASLYVVNSLETTVLIINSYSTS